MGFPEFSKSIPAQCINMLCGISRSSDSYIRRMTLVMQTPVLVVNMADKAGLKIPDALKGKVQWGRLVGKATKKLKEGKAAKTSRHSESNTWINPHASYFSDADYIAGMNLRAERNHADQPWPAHGSGCRQLQTLSFNGRENGTHIVCLSECERLKDSSAQYYSQLCG